MKVFKLLILAILILCLTGCAAFQGPGKTTKGTTEPRDDLGLPDNTSEGQTDSAGQPDIATEGLDWTFSVNDTVSGSYKLPAGGKALEYDITLRIVAWKSGGEDSFGKYEGEGYILFEFDESGLSNTESTYLGGGTFNRRCESLEFEIEESDQGAMASFQSNWYTTLSMDQTVEDRESGDTLSDIEGEFEGTTNKMGITLLIDDGYVTIDIPTYRLTWDCGYFTGMISHSPLGTTMRNKLNVPDVFRKDSDSEDADDEDENEGKDPDPTNDYGIPDYTFELPEGAPGFIFDPDENGRTGFDYNHDGKVDEYTDDKGNVYKDSDFDGVFETVYGSEWGMG